MQNHEMLIVKKAYDFSKWLLLHTGKFPKSYRFSIAVRIENAVLEFTELVAVANVRNEKRPLLEQADEALTRLRILVLSRNNGQFSGHDILALSPAACCHCFHWGMHKQYS